jgi:hypothetical protein
LRHTQIAANFHLFKVIIIRENSGENEKRASAREVSMGTKHSGDQQKIDILALNRMKLLDENEEEVLVSSYWKEHSVVLIFIRQFSCIACRAHVDQIIKKKSELEKKRTKVIFIGNGSPYMIKVF